MAFYYRCNNDGILKKTITIIVKIIVKAMSKVMYTIWAEVKVFINCKVMIKVTMKIKPVNNEVRIKIKFANIAKLTRLTLSLRLCCGLGRN